MSHNVQCMLDNFKKIALSYLENENGCFIKTFLTDGSLSVSFYVVLTLDQNIFGGWEGGGIGPAKLG